MKRVLLLAVVLAVPGVAWADGLSAEEKQSMDNTGASIGYLHLFHEEDIPDLHACARRYGVKNNFIETEGSLAEVMLKCSSIRDKFLADCHERFTIKICANTAALLILHGATSNKPLPTK